MKKLALLLPVTVALITACQGTPVPVTLTSLTLSGVNGPLQISSPAKLTATAIGSDGQPFVGTAVFTSSDPKVVSVGADGTLNVRHLSVAPVTLTVSEAGKTATLNVTTYGLDAAGGTFSSAATAANGKPGSHFAYVFRNADGSALNADTNISIQGPASFNGGVPFTGTTYKGTTLEYYDWYATATPAAVTGSYTATATVAGVVYRKTFNIDASSVLPQPSGVSVVHTAAGYTASGTLPAGATLINVIVSNETTNLYFSGDLTSLPANGTWSAPIPKGSYHTGVYAGSFTGNSGGVLPDQINRSLLNTADLVVP